MHPSHSSSACSLPMRDANTLCIPLLLCAKSLSCHASWKHCKSTLSCLLHSQAGTMVNANIHKLKRGLGLEGCPTESCESLQRCLERHAGCFGSVGSCQIACASCMVHCTWQNNASFGRSPTCPAVKSLPHASQSQRRCHVCKMPCFWERGKWHVLFLR
jgi:hypothetical protein